MKKVKKYYKKPKNKYLDNLEFVKTRFVKISYEQVMKLQKLSAPIVLGFVLTLQNKLTNPWNFNNLAKVNIIQTNFTQQIHSVNFRFRGSNAACLVFFVLKTLRVLINLVLSLRQTLEYYCIEYDQFIARKVASSCMIFNDHMAQVMDKCLFHWVGR